MATKGGEGHIVIVTVALQLEKAMDVGELRQKVAQRAYTIQGVANAKLLAPPSLDDLEVWMKSAVHARKDSTDGKET